MHLVFMSIILLELVLFAPLVMAGGRGLRREPDLSEPAGGWPEAVVIVALDAVTGATERALASLLAQDYGPYELLLCTREARPALTELMARVAGKARKPGLVVAGHAAGGGQKNRNLAAAVEALGPAAEVVVFCDSTHEAPPGFLKALIGPIARGQAEVTSGYHHVIPQGRGIAALARALTVLALYLTKVFSRLNQPWGGATALRRILLYELDVASLWAGTVVDDVVLAGRLKEAGISTALAPGACLETRIPGDGWAAYQEWLTRQWLFLKFVFPGSWFLLGLNWILLPAAMVIPMVMISAWLAGGLPPAMGAAYGGLFLAETALAFSLRRIHPEPGPAWLWPPAVLAAVGTALWVHLRHFFSREIRWMGTVYRVGQGGRVLGARPVGPRGPGSGREGNR